MGQEHSDVRITRRDVAKRLAAAAGGLAVIGCGSATGGRSAAAPKPNLSPLASRVGGGVVTREDPRYESVRQSMVWNGAKPSRRPDAIVRAASVSDVQEALRFAKRNRMKVAVRGGGHSWIGAPLRDGGILLDLSPLRELRFDESTRHVAAQPAVTGRELAKLLAPHGLAFPVGHCPSVPLSGFLLAGGFGWNTGAWGPACLSVRGIELVNADGEVVRASESENADLFWAARGGGAGFFGVVTGYELQTHPMPRAIRTLDVFFPAGDAPAAGRWLATSVVPALPKPLELTCVLAAAPPDLPAGAPRPGERVLVASAVAFADSDDEARAMLAPLLAAPSGLNPFMTPVGETSFERLLADFGRMWPHGARYGVDMIWCDTNVEDAIERLASTAAAAPSPNSFVMMVPLPPPPKDGPLPMPDVAWSMVAPVLVGVYGIWRSESDDVANRTWVANAAAAVRDVAAGHYVGEADLTAASDRARRCYSPAAWDRLRALKSKHDPAGVFHDFIGSTA